MKNINNFKKLVIFSFKYVYIYLYQIAHLEMALFQNIRNEINGIREFIHLL